MITASRSFEKVLDEREGGAGSDVGDVDEDLRGGGAESEGVEEEEAEEDMVMVWFQTSELSFVASSSSNRDMLFSSFLSIPTLLFFLTPSALADTEALVFTRPRSLPPRPAVSTFQILSSPHNLTAYASPGTNLLVHVLQEDEMNLQTDIGLFYPCADDVGGAKWMYRLSWLAQVRPSPSLPSLSPPFFALGPQI